MKLRLYIALITIATAICSCAKTDNVIANLEEIIALKTRNIEVYTEYERLARQDSALYECNVINMMVLAEKIQLDSCKQLYLSMKKKKLPLTNKQTHPAPITTNTLENLYRILVDKQLEGYNIMPSMNTLAKTKKAAKLAPMLKKMIHVNQHNATVLLDILKTEKYNDSTYKLNIITNF